MSAVLLGNPAHDSDEWHALRASGIGGSDIGAVVGLSKYQSPFGLWHQKRGTLPGPKKSEAMDWGNRLEGLVRERWAEEHPEFEVFETPGTYANSERDWQRVNPDGLIAIAGTTDPVALLEVKTSRFGDDFGKSGSTEIPLSYACQVQHALDVFGLPEAHVALLVGGNEFREYVIPANPEDQAYLRAKAEAFWHSVLNDDEPPLDASDHTYRAVVALNPEMKKDEFTDLTSDMWADYLKAKADLDEAEGELLLAKSRILQAMRGVQFARFAGQKVLRRQRSNGGTYHLREVS